MNFHGKNFQAWPEFSLDLKGFVVMIGSSFAGKSSIFRALRGILRNDISEQRIRHGADELELSFENEGKTIRAVRKANGSTKYLTDKGDYTSLAKNIPEVLKNLNAGEVQVGDYSIDPIFASQFGDQFMLEGTGPTELNTILGAFASTEKLENGKKQANLLVSRKNSEATTLAEQIGDAEERREKLGVLYEKGLLVDMAVRTLEPKARHAESVFQWLGQLATTTARLVPLRHLAESLAIPDTTEAERLQAQVLYLRGAARAQRRALRLYSTNLQLDAAIDGWNEIVALSRRAKIVNETTSLSIRLDKTHGLNTAKKLNDVIGQMETFLVSSIQLQASIKYTGQVVSLIQRVADRKAGLVQLEANLKELHEKHGLCAKCGKPLEHVCGS